MTSRKPTVWWLLVAALGLAGCGNPKPGKTYTVIDASGLAYSELRPSNQTNRSFVTPDGRLLHFRGSFTVVEEPAPSYVEP